jgi:hypothetical protein
VCSAKVFGEGRGGKTGVKIEFTIPYKLKRNFINPALQFGVVTVNSFNDELRGEEITFYFC